MGIIRKSFQKQKKNANTLKYYTYVVLNKISYYVFLILSVVMMNISISSKSFDMILREGILFVFEPIAYLVELPFNALSSVLSYVWDLVLINARNKELIAENISLKELHLKSLDIQSENENLKKILNFKDNTNKQYDFLTAKIYTKPKNNYTSNQLVLNVGSNDGVTEGNLVLNADRSVMGRVINVGKTHSNILLLNDPMSKIPARTNKERMIVSGNDDEYLNILYFKTTYDKYDNVTIGDFVYTSGDADLIPDGFFIGIVSKKKYYDNQFVIKIPDPTKMYTVIVVINPK